MLTNKRDSITGSRIPRSKRIYFRSWYPKKSRPFRSQYLYSATKRYTSYSGDSHLQWAPGGQTWSFSGHMACIDYMFKENYRCTDIVKLFCFCHLNIYLTLLSKILVAYICYNWHVQTSKIMICLHRNKFDRTLKHISYRGNEMRNERTKLLDFCEV